jgi:hypothetical protein
VVFFRQAFNEEEAIEKLADFEIVLSMRERTPLPGSLINRLSKLHMLGITGSRNLSSVDSVLSAEHGKRTCLLNGKPLRVMNPEALPDRLIYLTQGAARPDHLAWVGIALMENTGTVE